MKATLLSLLVLLPLAGPVFPETAVQNKALFNGRDLSGWKIPQGDNGHWQVINRVIDYDARSESLGDKNLWTLGEYGDFRLRIDWRIKETPNVYPMPDVQPDGSLRLDITGKPVLVERPNADSGILLRGSTKAQVNIWCWPIGSGEVYGYRTDAAMPPEVRAGVTPRRKADHPVGEWNTFEITLRGNRLTVILNGQTVIENAALPGIPARGPIGLQHHGVFKEGRYNGAASLVQFRNIEITELTL